MNTSDEYPDLNAFREKPCGRKAEWIVIGDVLDGGADFVVTCRECYQKGLGRYSLSTNDDLIPAGIFKDDFGRDPMCGDEDLGLSFAIEEATKEVADGPQSRPGFVRWVKRRDIEARFHRVAIHRRFQRIESSVAILSSIASIAVAIYAANASKKWLPWGEWSWGAVFFIVWVLLDRLIRLGRLAKHLKIKGAGTSIDAPTPIASRK